MGGFAPGRQPTCGSQTRTTRSSFRPALSWRRQRDRRAPTDSEKLVVALEPPHPQGHPWGDWGWGCRTKRQDAQLNLNFR